jgi:hypothetical protein
MAHVLAIRGSEYAFKVDGPSCPDRCNPDCACPACEASEAELETVDVLAVQRSTVNEKPTSVSG